MPSKKTEKIKIPLTEPTVAWFAVDPGILLRALNLALPLTRARSPLPIGTCVLLETTPDALVLSATDLCTMLTLTLPAQVRTPNRVLALPARTLADWVNTQPKEKRLEVALNATTFAAEWKGRDKAHLNGIAGDEFPRFPASAAPAEPTGESVTVILAAAASAAAVRRVAFAAEAEKFGRPVLEGVSARVAESSLILAAADGFRLAYERVALDGVDARVTAAGVLPIQAVELAAQYASAPKFGAGHDPAGESMVTLTLSENQVRFQMDDANIAATLVEGKYPEVERIIPDAHTAAATLDPNLIAAAVKATKPFANGNGVELTFAANTLAVVCKDLYAGDVVIEVPLKATSGLETPFSVRLESAFLREALEALDDAEELTFELDASDSTDNHAKPVVFHLPAVPTWTYVVMPRVR